MPIKAIYRGYRDLSDVLDTKELDKLTTLNTECNSKTEFSIQNF
jgi:hypothetical protein